MADDPVKNCQQPSRRPWPTQAINSVIDLLSLLVLLSIAGTGLVLKYVLPPGVRGGRGLRLWDLSRHEWGDIHFYFSIALAALIITHVALHWTWVCAVVGRWFSSKAASARQLSHRRRAAYGGAFLLAVAGLFFGAVWLASANATRSGGHLGGGWGRGYRGGRNAAVYQGFDQRTAEAPDFECAGSVFP